MKLFRHGPPGDERPGLVLPDGRLVSALPVTRDYDEAFFAADGMERLRIWINSGEASRAPRVSPVRFGSCVARPSKIICIGLNYRDHAAETNAALPEEPVLFMKATSALSGPNDDLVIPPGALKTDWEVELALVIGKTARRVSEAEALSHVAGYSLMIDYSERAWQKERAGQWVKGKSADTFAPLGPWLVSTDEVTDPHQLRLWLKVNGQLRQNGSTSDLIFKVPHLVSYVSQFMTLLPGDVISTGTPAGVAAGMKEPCYLRAGDVVEAGVSGLGDSRQNVRQG